METASIRAIVGELHRYHDESLVRWGEQLDADLVRTLELLPEPNGWTVAVTEPVAFAYAYGKLFRVRLDVAIKLIAVESRPLRAEKLCVTFRWTDESGDEETHEIIRSTRWVFFDVDEGEQAAEDAWQIDGAVRINSRGVERPDDRERFARSLAGDAGWGTVY